MSDNLTQAEEKNKALQNPDTEINEAKAGEVKTNTPGTEQQKTDFEDFATSIFEKVSKPKFSIQVRNSVGPNSRKNDSNSFTRFP